MAHRACREAINRRVTGSPHEWPFDWFKRCHSATSRSHGLSWGSGLGGFERWAIRLRIVSTVDAFDLSPVSIEEARLSAAAEGISGIHYQVGDFNHPVLDAAAYDIVFFHASLHHVENLEGLFSALSRALRPGGAIYIDDYIGRSRHAWRAAHLREAQAFLDRVPPRAKRRTTLDFPVGRDDPSEAVRSGELEGFLREYFDMIEWRPYGGQIAGLALPWIDPAWAASSDGQRLVQEMLDCEEAQLTANAGASDFVVAYGKLKPRQLTWRAAKKRRPPIETRVSLASARLFFRGYWLVVRLSRRLRSELATLGRVRRPRIITR
ncbi:hypothetical protein BH18ACT10_BH18ACT10_14060 [soil metagenome]